MAVMTMSQIYLFMRCYMFYQQYLSKGWGINESTIFLSLMISKLIT